MELYEPPPFAVAVSSSVESWPTNEVTMQIQHIRKERNLWKKMLQEMLKHAKLAPLCPFEMLAPTCVATIAALLPFAARADSAGWRLQ